ncbi:hypothetical protein [Streptomyces sp. RTd22]|uniref:hypothetical protein n=1 Tax=Streptomyces sp. RTd22 TaxID=1841249 RepID=UPI000AB95515|nr:hypothetical protein [Streptomyces sp. RTd22]
MSRIKVTRGNCPCLRADPRELATGPEGPMCTADEASCSTADLLEALPEPEAAQPGDIAVGSDGKVELRLSRLLPLYDGDFGDEFLLITSERVRRGIRLVADIPQPLHELEWKGPDTRSAFVGQLRAWRAEGRRASALWIAEDEFEHLLDDDAEGVKLGAISYFSSEFTPLSLSHYLRIITGTDYESELAVEGHLLSLLEEADALVLTTPELDTRCVFRHQETEHWFSLHGPLRFADQTVLPTGEISTLADGSGAYSRDSRMPIDGEIVFKGSPIIHRGDRTVTSEHTADTYLRLAPMEDLPVVAHVRNGYIHDFTAPIPEAKRLRDTFRALVDAEPQYRKIHEFGFGTHPGCANRLRSNFHPNERWPGIHIGLGLGGFTPFHIDLALTEVEVLLDSPTAGKVPLYQTLGLRR